MSDRQELKFLSLGIATMFLILATNDKIVPAFAIATLLSLSVVIYLNLLGDDV